jgi:hypothetical protein
MRNKIFIVFSLIATIFGVCAAGNNDTAPQLTEMQLTAICWKESSNGTDKRNGDNGNARGPYQIWRGYHKDSLQHTPTIGGTYEDCSDRAYSEKIVQSYMRRYAPKNASFREMCMIHNGGPNILKKKNGNEKERAAYARAMKYADIVERNLKSLTEGKTPKNE